ncbi:MAG: hypothetical protein K8R79_10325 [Calditrichales bacterium]|nr:hypothetical protein [Calditrichales bacterium]
MDKGKILEQLAKFKDDNSKALWMLERIEKDYERFKDKLTDTTAKTINEIFEEDLQLSENVRKWAYKGKLYDNIIQQFKIRISVDDCLMDEQALSLLREAKGTILNLRSNIAKAKNSTAMVKDDIKTMRKQLYIYKRLDEMKINNLNQHKIKTILLEGDIDNLSEYEIDKKINLLLEG